MNVDRLADAERFKAQLKSAIAIGDVVTLKSGGAQMTVTDVTDGKRPNEHDARCVWIDEMGTEHTMVVDVRCLQ